MYQMLNKVEKIALDKKTLKEYLEKLASDNVIKEKSNIDTYPVPRVIENFKYISLIYTLLNEHIKLGIAIHPAGEWLLDNYYLIENTVRTIQKDLSKTKYEELPKISNGSFSGFARIYVLSHEIVMNTDGRINGEELKEYIEAYQKQKNLSMQEIWDLGIFLEISIIEKIRWISEKIFISQMQRFKVDNIIERILENKNVKKLKIDVDLYPFIEYMSYRLRMYGEKANKYLEILEEQVRKNGMTVTDVINKEHFDIALKKVSMKNCITSIKEISRMDILDIFENVSIVEKILSKDEIYVKMDYPTKNMYREEIQKLAKKHHISEVYIAQKALELCENKKEKKAHIGYYIISEGKSELLEKLINKKIRKIKNKTKVKIYVGSIYLITILLVLAICAKSIIFGILSFIPIQYAVTKLFQYLLSKIVKPKLMPKLDFQDTGIPKEYSTMCVITSIIKDTKNVEELMKKLEVYYLANKSKNIYFTLLGDPSSEKKENMEVDKDIIVKGKEIVKQLNQKYGNIFGFIYRKREWCTSERCFMGWERKRGILNQLNEYLITKKNPFLVNTWNDLPKIKYVITLDSDTKLVLNTGLKLIGTMAHILNKPEVNKITNTVEAGHALIQPRVGVGILAERKSMFTRIFAGSGGTDLYSNAISDVYQDNFDEGIYTGKGIYDVEVFYEVLKGAIPENTVLSHDLLEGNYLRCGLSSDIVLMDGYPSHYISYKKRKHRWIRGDVQILPWLNSTLNFLSKYKIIDNIVRDIREFCIILMLIFTYIASFYTNEKIYLIITLVLIAIPAILELVEYILGLKDNKQKLIVNKLSNFQGILLRFISEIMILPDMAYAEINAFVKSIYRMKISHSYMLEWTTAEQAEHNKKEFIKDYYLEMIPNSLLGIIFLLNNNVVFWIIGLIFLIGPMYAHYISKEIKNNRLENIQIQDEKFLIETAYKTWQFFKENSVKGLPIDNYQEDRKQKRAYITSPTNIGLYLLSTIAAYDLEFEDLNSTIKRLEESIETIENLSKWNGHLYNWYNINTLKPIKPLYISSVDSGNLVGYLYTLKQFLLSKDVQKNDLAKRVEDLINQTDFSKLYNEKIGLFSIGYNIEENELTDSYYDLLATEARQTSLVAIAKKDVPSKHWNNLGRTLTKIGMYKGLVSWGGTAFEYLMPTINIPSYETTLLDESCRFSVISQRKYAKKLGTMWGISESAYNTKDTKGNYQYKTFGIPWLGLKRGLEEVVVSPYSTAMSLNFYPKESIENLKELENNKVFGKYGFYESIDYTPKKAVTKTFMAHHQGLILTSIDNLLKENIFQKRFMENAEMEGVDILLEEKMPENVIITKEKKEKVEKIKYKDYEEYTQREAGINVLANEKYSVIMKDDGSSYNKYGNDIIGNNIHMYIKDINSKKIYDTVSKNIKIIFTTSESKITIQDGNLLINMKVTIVPNLPIEVRALEIKNTGNNNLSLEVTSFMDVILTSLDAYNSHPAFNKMFIDYKKIDNGILFTRRVRDENKPRVFVATSLVYDEGDLEFEIDKEKFTNRGNLGIPKSVEDSMQLSKKIETNINPIVAMRRLVNLKPNETKNVFLVNAVGDYEEEAITNLNEYMKSESLNRVFDIAKSNTEAEMRYLSIKGKDIDIYQNMLEKLLNPLNQNSINYKQDLSNDKIWKYGISGDYPILIIKLKDVNDIYLLKEILKAKEYFNIKNIKVDIIVLTDDENVKIEDSSVKILYNISREDKKILELRANLVIDSKLGSLYVQIKTNENKNRNKNNYQTENKTNNNINIENKEIEKNKLEDKKLLYYNGYGGFSKDGNEYHICTNKNKKVPMAWSNIMGNKSFGTVITEAGGGFTWYENSKVNRITKFSNDAFLDKPSEKILIEENKKIWSITCNNYADNKNYYVTYGLGYAKFEHSSNEIEQNMTVYIPINNNLKINLINLKNTSLEKKKIKIIYDVDFQLGEKETRFISYNFKDNLNMVYVRNNTNPKYCTYISSNKKMKFENNKIIIELEIESLENINVSILLGAEKEEMDSVEISGKYLGNEIEELEKVKKYWKEKTRVVESFTPLDSFNIMQNNWLIYQTIVSRMLSKSGFYQSGGAYGYRDQLQDAMGMKFVDPNILKEQIILHSKHQFIEGDVEHWWHEETSLGIRARYTDDLLWLPYAVMTYIDFTGDYSILDVETEYVQGRVLNDNEHDYVDIFLPSNKKESIYHHCMRAINKSIDFERFPKIHGGDWNDGMNKIGEKGIGESVWLGFFMYQILIKFAEYSKYVTRFANKETAIALNEQNKNVDVKTIDSDEIADEYERLTKKAELLRKNLNNEGFDGRWYRRAVDDTGKFLGSANNKECKIDGLSQSWAVISMAGDNDKKYIAMESVEKYLVDKENNLIRLLTPPFQNQEFKPGYIASYAQGMRENGGQYTHAAIWDAIAEAKLNKQEEAMQMYKMINPIEHSKTEEQANKYKVEPYVVAADIYSMDNFAGRGGWTWYTGSSSWLYTLQTEYILGIKIYHGILKIRPCMPKEWKNCEVKFRWKNAIYDIHYEKDLENEEENDITKDSVKMFLDGVEVDEIKLDKNGSFNITVKF